MTCVPGQLMLVEKSCAPLVTAVCKPVCEPVSKPICKLKRPSLCFFKPFDVLPTNLFWQIILTGVGVIVILCLFAVYNNYVNNQINIKIPIPIPDVLPDKILIHAGMKTQLALATSAPLLFELTENNYSRVNGVITQPLSTRGGDTSVITSTLTGVYEVSIFIAGQTTFVGAAGFPLFIIYAYNSAYLAPMILYYGTVTLGDLVLNTAYFSISIHHYITINKGDQLSFRMVATLPSVIGGFNFHTSEGDSQSFSRLYVHYLGEYPPDTYFDKP